MIDYEHLLVEVRDRVALITMNRPKVLNAMNRALCGALRDAADHFAADDGVGCIVITGAGERAFSAGGDIHEQRRDERSFSEEELGDRHLTYMRGAYAIAACPKPTIGMLNGLAYGGGAVLASSLDVRIGCEDAKFRFLAAAYGRINSTWTLPNQVGWPIAKELLFTARVVKAEEAHRIGLLNHLVPRDELLDKTMEIATTIAGNDHRAVMGIKKLLLDDMGRDLEQQWSNERDFTRDVLRGTKTEDAFPEFIARKGRAVES